MAETASNWLIMDNLNHQFHFFDDCSLFAIFYSGLMWSSVKASTLHNMFVRFKTKPPLKQLFYIMCRHSKVSVVKRIYDFIEPLGRDDTIDFVALVIIDASEKQTHMDAYFRNGALLWLCNKHVIPFNELATRISSYLPSNQAVSIRSVIQTIAQPCLACGRESTKKRKNCDAAYCGDSCLLDNVIVHRKISTMKLPRRD